VLTKAESRRKTMNLYVAINLKDEKVLFITDNKAAAEQSICKEGEASGECRILSTENVSLTAAAQAEVSMSYEEGCVRESVCTILWERGINEDLHPAEFTQLTEAIAADAYRDMLKYDVSEDYAIGEAVKEHDKEITALLEK